MHPQKAYAGDAGLDVQFFVGRQETASGLCNIPATAGHDVDLYDKANQPGDRPW